MSNKGMLVLLFLILLVLVLSSRREGASMVNAKKCSSFTSSGDCNASGCYWWIEPGHVNRDHTNPGRCLLPLNKKDVKKTDQYKPLPNYFVTPLPHVMSSPPPPSR